MRFVILDYRGFETDQYGRLRRDRTRDLQIVAEALNAAGVLSEPGRKKFDLAEYHQEVAKGCFICRLIQRDPTLPHHHIVWQSDDAIVFLDRFPTTFGYTLVAPIAHREQASQPGPGVKLVSSTVISAAAGRSNQYQSTESSGRNQ